MWVTRRHMFCVKHKLSWKFRTQPESTVPHPLTMDHSGWPLHTCLSSRQLPHAPEHPVAMLSTVERRAINLTWAKPFDGNSPLIRYVLEMSENSKVPVPLSSSHV